MAAAAKGPRTILVVDDEPMVRMVIGRLLQKWDFRVVEADSGRSALEMARSLNGALCLVITDLNMPQMDGYQLATALSPLYPDLPILFVTGKCPNALMGDLSTMQDHLLFKPFYPDALLDAVARLLESHITQQEFSA